MSADDKRPAWVRNAQAFEDLAEQSFPAITPAESPSLPPARAPTAVVSTLLTQASASGGREVQLVDGGRRYRVSSGPAAGKARVAVGAVNISGPGAKPVGLRLPAALMERLTQKTLGQISAAITALLVHALDRLTEQQLNLVWDQDENWRTEPGTGRVETGRREITGPAHRATQRYPGALLALIDERRVGARPATFAALLAYGLDDVEARGLEIGLRVEAA